MIVKFRASCSTELRIPSISWFSQREDVDPLVFFTIYRGQPLAAFGTPPHIPPTDKQICATGRYFNNTAANRSRRELEPPIPLPEDQVFSLLQSLECLLFVNSFSLISSCVSITTLLPHRKLETRNAISVRQRNTTYEIRDAWSTTRSLNNSTTPTSTSSRMQTATAAASISKKPCNRCLPGDKRGDS